MEVGRAGVECVAFWACHFCSVVVGPSVQGQADFTMETFLEVSVAREWQDDTNGWVLGQCWMPLAVGTLVLKAFGGGELLDMLFPHL